MKAAGGVFDEQSVVEAKIRAQIEVPGTIPEMLLLRMDLWLALARRALSQVLKSVRVVPDRDAAEKPVDNRPVRRGSDSLAD